MKAEVQEPTGISRRERRNIAVYLLFSAMYGVATNICSEGYIQSYLLHLGFGTGGVRNYGIVAQLFPVAAYLIYTRLPLTKERMKKIYTTVIFIMCVFPATLAAAGYIRSFRLATVLVLSTAALYGFLNATRSVTEYNMTPYLFRRRLYANASSLASIVGGVIPVCVSLLTGFLMNRGGSGTYTLLFSISPAAFFIAALITFAYRLDSAEPGQAPPLVSYAGVLKRLASKSMLKRLAPHFLRGVGMAGIYYIVPSALKNIRLGDSGETLLIVIPIAATIAGSSIFMLISKKAGSGAVSLVSTAACSLLMPVLVLLTDKRAFFPLYLLFYIFNFMSQLSIPTGVLRSTPNEDLPLISSMRLLIMSGASSIFIFIFGSLPQAVAPVYIMIFAGAAFTLCGVVFRRLFSDHLKV